MRRVLIENAAVATMDPQLGEFARADILVERDTIAAIGPDLEVGEVSERIDASQMVAVPGLVDAHRHTWRVALGGLAAEGGTPDRDLVPHYRPEDMYAGTLLGALDALNSGVTTLVDRAPDAATPEHVRAAVAGLHDAGVRGVHVQAAATLRAGAGGALPGGVPAGGVPAGLLHLGVAPPDPATAPPGDLRGGVALARALDARIVVHGAHAVAALHRDGLFGDDVLLVHASSTPDGQWAMLDGTGATMAFCAEADLAPRTARAIHAATEHTPGPALGSDGMRVPAGDMLRQARLALQATRWSAEASGAGGPTARDALGWVTVNGARAAGLDDVVGSLSPGKRADLVLIDMSGVSELGWDRRDPCGTVIHRSHPGLVDTVLVNGAMVKRAGRLCHVDLGRARALLVESQDHIRTELSCVGGPAATDGLIALR